MTTAQGDSGRATTPLPPPPPRQRPRIIRVLPSRAGRWLLAAATFVVGLFAGALIVGFFGTGSSTPVVRTVTVTPSPSPSPGASSGAGQFTVNAACLQAVKDTRSVSAALGDLTGALQSFDLSRINGVVTRLRSLQNALRADLGSCHVTGGAGAPSPSSS